MTDTVATRYAGTRVPRIEDNRLLTGRGTFVDDVTRPGMLHACFVRSPFARAKINRIDAAAALALPGVRAVFTAGDLNPDVKEAWHAVAGKDMPDTPRPPLAEGEVKFVGDPVAIVVAESRYIAEDAVELVDVDYEPLPATACQASLTSGLRSAAVNTARTPGRASAGAASMPLIFARAKGLRTKQACSIPGRVTSSTKVPLPVSKRLSSTRGTRVPAYRVATVSVTQSLPSYG